MNIFSKSLFALLWVSSMAQGNARIEAYGDSLTAGFVSQFNVTQMESLKPVGRLISDLAMYAITDKPHYILPYIRKDLAWPQYLSKELEKLKIQTSVRNESVPGAQAVDTWDQVVAAPAYSDPTVGFFFIGHNDLCNNTDSPQTIARNFSSRIEKAIRAWDARHENSTLVLLPVGPIHTAFESLENYTWYHSDKGRYQCRDSWKKLFPWCPWFAQKQDSGELREILEPRIDAMNEVLRQLSEKEGYRNPVVAMNDDLMSPIETKMFSVDCFHLSPEGQSALAEKIYQRMDWDFLR